MKKKIGFLILLILFMCLSSLAIHAEENRVKDQLSYRMDLYREYSVRSGIPWYIVGAIDQYERNTKNYRDYCPKEEEVISICIEPKRWSGFNNPFKEDRNPYTIELFYGIGIDGDDDGYADRTNPLDRLATILNYVTQNGNDEEYLKKTLMDYYNSEKGIQIIYQISSLFSKYESIELSKRVFPIPKHYRADYSNNFGTGRSWGGARSHEGVDIFAFYGTPVVSTSYGVIEIMGWNNYGGYRMGIRDMYNTYQYYAHLNYYSKDLKLGDIVEPGQVIGYVGSTGYGKEGTSGKFPPHLHYGFYKFDGRKEWSFNPYSYLRRWERIRLK
ncbi:MAG: peptidase [Haloplasmataceae bacterium]|jgi:hypothetical protein|nr:peptidase [Haloplasmataceae bacterium]